MGGHRIPRIKETTMHFEFVKKGGDLKIEEGEYRNEIPIEKPLETRPLRFSSRKKMSAEVGREISTNSLFVSERGR